MKACFFILTIFLSLQIWAQEDILITDTAQILKVHIECQQCDKDYFSENMDLGQMVTTPQSSDVQVNIAEYNHGGSTLTYNYMFTGKKRFCTIHDTLVFNIPTTATMDEKREIQLEKLRLGLVPYILKTAEADRLFLFVSDKEVTNTLTKDPWRNWVFDISAMGSIFDQRYYKAKNLMLNLYISKITEELKIESQNQMDYSESNFIYFDADSNEHTISSSFRGYYSHSLVVRSLGDHWGIGGMLYIMNDRPNNLDLRYRIGPAVEYNIYSYKKALQKQFRFLYSVLYEQSNYVDLSIYDKMQNTGWRQNMSVMARFNQPWGYIDASIGASQYLSDLSKYSVNGFVMTSIHVPKVRGLSVNLSCGLSMFRDKIHQAKGFATAEEIYTRQRAISTDYQFSFSVGISITIGSGKYRRVNPRFSR